jgi:hypothetical protein
MDGDAMTNPTGETKVAKEFQEQMAKASADIRAKVEAARPKIQDKDAL